MTDDVPPLGDPGTDSVRQLLEIEAIKQLKARYFRFIDTKQWDDFEACFLPEATADYAGLVFPDRAALVDYMRQNLGPAIVTMHHVHHPEIAVDGDTATGRWYLIPLCFVTGYAFAWAAHFLVEKNRPATFTYPFWSFISDYKMMGYMITGRMNAEVERVTARN